MRGGPVGQICASFKSNSVLALSFSLVGEKLPGGIAAPLRSQPLGLFEEH